MPKRTVNLARLIKECERTEAFQLRCTTQAILVAHLHGHDLTSELLTPQDLVQLEMHYIRILLVHSSLLIQADDMDTFTTVIESIHPTYRGSLLDQLEPMEVETCSEDEAMPGQ